MKIMNINGLTAHDLQRQVDNGAQFIYFAYTISLIVVTFKRTSGVYLVQQAENRAIRGIPFTMISLLFGWWGIPFGPLYTIESIRTNMRGKDVTDEVMATVTGYMQFEETQQNKKTEHS